MTGCAAPMCVPGAMAAMSAAMVMRNPAEAGRLPDGPTNTATGVFAAMMALLMSRVASSRPPGVCSVNTIRAAPSASALAMADRMNSELTGWMIPSTVAVSTIGLRSAPARRATVMAIATPKDARLRIMVSPFVDTLLKRLRLAGRGIERQRLLDLSLRRCHVLQPQVRVGERHMRRGGIAAPDRNLQRVDGFARTPGTEVDSADQQGRLRCVGREEDC